MLELRPYQADAVAALFSYFETSDGHPVVSLPTASGKSIIQAAFVSETLARWPGERFVLLTHVKELLQQNAAKLTTLGVKCGLYSAGLGKKEIAQVTVAGIQSIWRKAHELGDVSIIMIDECHLLSGHDSSMYRTFITDLAKYCPHVKVIGLSATPFRMDSGSLIDGKGRLFTDVAYSVSIRELIDAGYLSPLTTAPTKARTDTSSVARRGGEYVPSALELAMDRHDITKAALDEVERLAADRKSWLVFCVGVDHADHVCEAIAARGHAVTVVTGKTPAAQRAAHIDAFKAGRLRALVSVGVLTTGFDAPCVDAIVCLRPTLSPGLWVQICGRGTRLHPGKSNCLVLDFTQNIATHGPIDRITVSERGECKCKPPRICIWCGGLIDDTTHLCESCGKEMTKVCPFCESPMPWTATQCPDCGKELVRRPRVARHNTEASSAPILSEPDKPDIREVRSWDFARHTKPGKPDSVRVRYWCGLEYFDEWLCPEHGGYATAKACLWWRKHASGIAPVRTNEALERAGECRMPQHIVVRREGKYYRVL